jgi:putative ATP-dependent endonuclease of OLD family
MQVVEFSLQRYRSIQKAEKIQLGDLTVLIGPNNEGKSNILRGLVTSMRLLAKTPGSTRTRQQGIRSLKFYVEKDDYNWARDFPVGLQDSKPDGKTVFDITFGLSADEQIEFQKEVKSKLNGTLPIRLTAGKSTIEFEVRKQGKGGVVLTKKRDQIAKFIASRLNPQDIPSIRTAEASMRIVDDMVRTEFRRLDGKPEYIAAQEQIAELQKPILEEIEENLRTMLNTFLPDVRDVKLEVRDRFRSMSECEIVVDDGTATDLRHKGDGVQSLAAISLIHHVAEQSPTAKEIILALEEPEAHLHPRAVHQIRNVLQEIASRQQVILTTHSPLLVNRKNIESNVIVHRKKAFPAESISQIREVLGVRVADNLSAAELVLVVEGSEDTKALEVLLPLASEKIRAAIDQGRLVIDDMHGTGNLRYRLALMADQLCGSHVLLDHDAAGLAAAEQARAEGLLEMADHTFANSIGMKESEFEDWISLKTYVATIKRKYSVNLDVREFRNRNKKWSARVEREFRRSGQIWDDSVKAGVKDVVATLVAANPAEALMPEWSTAFLGLVGALEAKLDSA